MVALFALALLAAPLDKSFAFKTAPAPSVRVGNISGVIDIQAGAGDEVTVRATSANARDMRVSAKQSGDEVRVGVCCGEGCEVDRPDHHDNCNGGDIDLVVRVPSGSTVQAGNVSGDLRVSGVRGELSLTNVSGKIDVSGSEGNLRINSVSGEVHLAPREPAATKVSSVSGDVKLVVPKGKGATVSLSSLSGELSGGVGHGTRRTLGGGGATISVSSVSGSVSVEER